MNNQEIITHIKPYCFERCKDLLRCLGKKASNSNSMRLLELIAQHFEDFDNGNGVKNA